MGAKETITELFSTAGITINGKKEGDVTVHNEGFYARVLSEGSIGLGESYMDGWWDAKLDVFFYKLLSADLNKKANKLKLVLPFLKATLTNMQTKKKSKEVAKIHYDLGNDFYTDMLDDHMQYTCAYWKDAKTLTKAQENKLRLVCEKIQLKKGETVLELGGGWGGFAHFAAKEYGATVTSYNISKEQVAFARKKNKDLPVTIVHDDYRNATGTFDKVVSIGMCEHVGVKNYRGFMKVAERCMKKDGLFLMHTIGTNFSTKITDPWIDKYIFPGGKLPSIAQLAEASEGIFVTEDVHNLNVNYDKTLMAWHDNFTKSWDKYKDLGERFYRMWSYYLLSCAGAFRSRNIQLWQFVYSKKGREGYQSIR